MTRLFSCVLAVAVCIGPSCGDEPNKAVQEELKRLEGEWRVVATEADGKQTESVKGSVKFVDSKCIISTTGCGLPDIETTITIDPTQKLKWMDVTNSKKVTQKGIYELNGDKLKAVFQADTNGERPTEFKTKKGEVMYTYERIKPK